ncbi:hypothetical protein Acr_02g0012900 [Actinidia rufa]|uniref:DUF4283 domain-containing protein n=1 Tax=Actinidia rufa TaxID=165716 RepID=A0A7J0E9H0_9ERIC|nr:hypothetical protein Acr_02g0012900 [Actinidia rufa]
MQESPKTNFVVVANEGKERNVINKGKRGADGSKFKGVDRTITRADMVVENEMVGKINGIANKIKMSYADVVKSSYSMSVKVQGEGNEWLSRSVVAKNHSLSYLQIVTDLARKGGMEEEVVVRKCGGKNVIVTFKSVNAMKKEMSDKNSWLFKWFEEVEEWSEKALINWNRSVWLKCYGIPLQFWNNNTFLKIGNLWGEVLAIDDETANYKNFEYGRVRIFTSCFENICHSIQLDHNGLCFPVRIMEEVEKCLCVKGNRVEGRPEKVDDVCVNEEVQESCFNTFDSKGRVENVARNSVPCNTVSWVRETPLEKGKGNNFEAHKEGYDRQSDAYGATQSLMINYPVERGVDGTSGWIRSVDGVVITHPGINLEVCLGLVNSVGKPIEIGPSSIGRLRRNGSASNEDKSGSDSKTFSVNSNGENGFNPNFNMRAYSEGEGSRKKKTHYGKNKDHSTKRVVGAMRRLGSGGRFIKRKNQKGAIFRAAAASIALSISTESTNNRGRIMLNEAQATWEMGKALGLVEDGSNENVICKIMELEENDERQYEKMKGAPNT